MMYSLRRASLVVRHAARRLSYSTPPPPKTRTRHLFRTTLLVASALSGGTVLGLYYDAKSCPSPPFQLAETASQLEHDHDSPPLLTLLRTYFVYGLISCDTIVDHAPDILNALLKVPLMGSVAEAVVRRTFFEHACISYYLISVLEFDLPHCPVRRWRNSTRSASSAVYSAETEQRHFVCVQRRS